MFADESSHVQVGLSDDLMSHVTETAKPKKGAVTLTIDQNSDSSGNTEFYEDPSQQETIRDAEARGSQDVPTIQGQVAEREIQLLRQQSAQEAMSRSREAEEMARGWVAMQQQQYLLAER